MLNRFRQSLYLKLFLSFLATCILFFVGLALFWNSYFADLFYKDKKELLLDRSEEVQQMYRSFNEGTLSSRELRFGIRLIARSFNGQVWIVNPAGMIQYGTEPEMESRALAPEFSSSFHQSVKGAKGYTISQLRSPDGKFVENYLVYAKPDKPDGEAGAVFFVLTPVNDISSLITAVRWNIWVPLLFSLAAVGLILFTLSRKLAGPLQQMNQAALALADGDFTTRVEGKTDDEIGQLAKSFNFMVSQLQQWEDTRQEFLTNISHELRSPLTTLRGLILAMNDQVIPEQKIPHYLKICDQEVQRLQRLVSELLDLARIQNSSPGFRFRPVDVVRLTKQTVDVLAPSMQEKGLKLEVWLPEGSDGPHGTLSAMLDPDRYAQIVNNLLYNAKQFTPSGKRIIIHLGEENGTVFLRVRDEGIGMTEEEKKRIWDRFYKADPSREQASDGTGLGLTIVRHLVLGMSGTIEVDSLLGRGTTFTVRFPLNEETARTVS